MALSSLLSGDSLISSADRSMTLFMLGLGVGFGAVVVVLHAGARLPLRVLLDVSSGLVVSWRIFLSTILMAAFACMTLLRNSESLFSSRSVIAKISSSSLMWTSVFLILPSL